MIVVVLGVLIALAAQEWADEWSWRAKADDTLQQLQAEVGVHYTWSVEWRMIRPCVNAQIDALQRRVLASGDRLDPAPTYSEPDLAEYVVRLPSKTYTANAWTAALNSGAVPHLSADKQASLNAHYATVQNIIERTALNDAAYQRLFSLSRPLELNAQVRFDLLQALDEMRGRVGLMDLESAELIAHAVELKAAPPPAQVRKTIASFGTFRFCRAHGLPMRSFEEASRPVP